MPDTPPLALGEAADEAAWRALVDKGLKGAAWSKLARRTADGIEIAPLYRETDIATATDVSGAPGAAPFIRGARTSGGWLIRQRYDHPDPERTNRDILADLEGGVSAIELVIDPAGAHGAAIRNARDLDIALSGVMLDAAPVSLDAGAFGIEAAGLLLAKLAGGDRPGVAFNLDPIGTLMRTGAMARDAIDDAAKHAGYLFEVAPEATSMRIDARPIHEAGGTEAQEIAVALCSGIAYLRALRRDGSIEDAAAALYFTLSVGPDVLVETAKLRALRMCWARVMEAAGARPEQRTAPIHAVTSQRMMTRYDAWTNILRVTTAAFAAAIGGADSITTLPFTHALGAPTPFARRVARNTQHVLLEEAHLGHVVDPAGGSWFVEKLTRDLAELAWEKMQALEAQGGIVRAFADGRLQADVFAAREARARAFATRRETITGVTDFPLLDAEEPAFEKSVLHAEEAAPRPTPDLRTEWLLPYRWAEPFEDLRARAEQRRRAGDHAKAPGPRPSVFFANLGALADFSPRAQFARNLFAVGGVGALGAETPHADLAALTAAFAQSEAKVAVLAGADAAYAEHAAAAARALKQAGATWLVLAGKPDDALSAAGIDQFVFAGCDALEALGILHHALGIRA